MLSKHIAFCVAATTVCRNAGMYSIDGLPVVLQRHTTSHIGGYKKHYAHSSLTWHDSNYYTSHTDEDTEYVSTSLLEPVFAGPDSAAHWN